VLLSVVHGIRISPLLDKVKNYGKSTSPGRPRAVADDIYVQADAWVHEGVLSGCTMLELNDSTKDAEEKLAKSL
jgi:hypothetical protein